MTVSRGSAAPALYLSDMGEQTDESGPTARSDSVAGVRTLAVGRLARRRRSPAPRIEPRERGGDVTALRVGKPELRPFFTPKGLAEYLSISERTVREMLSKERIPSYKVEGQRRIDPADVDRYLARNRNGAA